MSLTYRREIDGLRAVAVVPVVLFHAGFGLFEGGFLGVDVFFVLSGYLITAILIGDLEGDRFSILRFYERRARRILPALFVVLGCCLPFAWLWMRPLEFDGFLASLIAVILFLSNVHFWRETDYFGGAAEETPLLHTWSLAVEEQFYLVFPILLLVLWRFGARRAGWTLVGLAVASLMFSEWFWRVEPSANFFLPASRAWELLSGSVCAFLLSGRRTYSNDALAALGLGMILVAMVLFDEATPIPSLRAVLPVGGTMLVVLFAGSATWTGRLLGLPVLVGIGLVSYSAYLWHQPLFAFARIRSLREPDAAVMLVLIVVTFALAYLTWRFVETPFRKPRVGVLKNRQAIFAGALGLSAAFVVIGATGDNRAVFAALHTPEQLRILSYADYAETPEMQAAYRKPQCFYGASGSLEGDYRPDVCLAAKPGQTNVLLIGDSHGAHLWYGLTQVFPEANVMQATASGCKPLRPYAGEARCLDLMRLVFERYLPAHLVDEIVLAGRWRADDLQRLEETVTYLARYAGRITVIRPTAEYDPILPEILGRLEDMSQGDEVAAAYLNGARFDLARRMGPEVEELGARYVDIAATMCPSDRCRTFTAGGVPMVWDYGHYTIEGAIELLDELKRRGQLDFGKRLTSSDAGGP